MESLFVGREAEFDGGRGYDLFDHKGAKPFVVQLLGQAGGHIVLGVQPYFGPNFVDRCRASLVIIMPCHLICCVFESSLCLFLHLGHLLGKVIHSFYGRTLV